MYAKLMNNLEILKLEKMYSYIPAYLDTVAKEGTSVLDALVHLTDLEISYKDEMASKIQVSVAGFPFVKRMEEYDYDFQPFLLHAMTLYKILEKHTMKIV